jgi:simple sugar transport system permease protein
MSYIIIYKTRFGLRLRAVGENPSAADSLGISVDKIKYFGVLISGALAGLGGAWLAFDQHSFTDGMSAGRGYIALAAMIIGKWNPWGAAGACLVFGFAESLSIQFQNLPIPTQFIQMLPYVLTIIVLAGFIGKSTPPAADGIPYEKD